MQAVECSRSHNELYTVCSSSVLVGKLRSVDGSSQLPLSHAHQNRVEPGLVGPCERGKYVVVQCVM